MNANESFRVMISTGHLGTAPSGLESFRLAMESGPDVLVADGGSSDPGPVYLGENLELGHFVREELELFVTESRKRGIPFVVGSAGDSGSNDGVNRTVALIKDIAAQHRISRFRIGYFYSEVPKDYLKRKLAAGNTLAGLNGFPNLEEAEIEDAARIVAVAGVHPFIKLFDMGADVIVGGRCGDICFTAAPCIRAGFSEALAYHMGKMIECASLVGEPFMGKETVIGILGEGDCFGERALLRDKPYGDTALALEDCEFSVLRREHLAFAGINDPNFRRTIDAYINSEETEDVAYNELQHRR